MVQEAHARSFQKDVPLSPEKCKKLIMFANGSPTQFLWVSEIDGSIEGVLAGLVDEIYWSRKKEASDIFFFVTDKAKNDGYKLAKKFAEWARAQDAVVMWGFSISSGFGEDERIGKMYKRLGLTRLGGIYMEIKDNVQSTEEYRQGIQEGIQGPEEAD